MNDPNRKPGSEQATMVAGSSASGASSPARAFALTGVNLSTILETGTVLSDRYEIIEMLGIGGMGAVYKARDRELDRVIALKVIRPDLANDPMILQRFKQELLLARQVTHRNIIRIFDLGESTGMRFITMEFVEGTDLRGVITDRGKLSGEEATKIMRQVLSGLAAAHSEGVIHRDLKPSNIMCDKQGRVVVMDFGLARSAGADGMTQTGAMLGTMEYMSPEQANGNELDARSDLFTTGLIFYELVTGLMPYKADSAIASLVKRTREAAIPAITADASVPQPLSNIIARCLERDPQHRYGGAEEIIADLDAWLGGKNLSAVTTRSIGASEITTRVPLPAAPVVRSRPKWLIPGIAAAVVLVIAAAVTWYMLRTPTPTRTAGGQVSVLVADFENRTSEGVFEESLEPTFSLALEGASFINSFSRNQARKIAMQLKPGSTGLDEAGARLTAMREGISVVLSGAVEKDAAGYKVSAKAMDAVTGRTIIAVETTASSKDEVLKGVATLAAKVRTALGDSTPESQQLAKLETLSASSLDAAHEYALAQNLQVEGKWEESIPYYNRALQFDPNLGRAYSGLAAVNANMGRREDADKYYQLAIRHLDRMTEREKFRTRGGYYLVRQEPHKAIEEYKGLLAQFPADVAGASNLAFCYFELREMKKAVQEGQRVVEITPNGLMPRTNLALYAIYAGDFDTAIKEANEVLKQNPTYVNALAAIGMAQTGQGKLSDAAQTYERLGAISERGAAMATVSKTDLLLYQGQADEALSTAAKLPEGADKFLLMAGASLIQGQARAAATAANKALALAPTDERVIHAAGRILAASGDTSKATALAKKLQQGVALQSQILGKLLSAEVSLQKHDARAALAEIGSSQQLLDTWLGHYLAGRAYLEAGMLVEAQSEFDKCLTRRGEASALYLDDVPTFRVLPPLFYYIAKTQEATKNPSASASFEKFLAMYPKAPRNNPLVVDALRKVSGATVAAN